MPEIKANAGVVTQINVFTMLPENQQRIVEILTEANSSIGEMPGWISASIHRSLDGTRVVNYVQYESREAWEAVVTKMRAGNQTKMRAGNQFGKMRDIATAEPGLYEVVFTLDR